MYKTITIISVAFIVALFLIFMFMNAWKKSKLKHLITIESTERDIVAKIFINGQLYSVISPCINSREEFNVYEDDIVELSINAPENSNMSPSILLNDIPYTQNTEISTKDVELKIVVVGYSAKSASNTLHLIIHIED